MDDNTLHYRSVHIARFSFLFRQIARLGLSQTSTLLDIGCYPPVVLDHLLQISPHVYGISSPHEPLNRSHVHQLDIQTQPLPFDSDRFDLVIFTEILEHLYLDPTYPLSKIYRVLKKGGYLIVTTPNVLRFQNIINLLLGNNPYFPLSQFTEPLNARHCREYSQAELIAYFNQLKFKVVKARPFIAYPPYRAKNVHDRLLQKIIKYSNYLLSLFFPSRRDTLFFLLQK